MSDRKIEQTMLALCRVVLNDLAQFENMPEEWKLGYQSAIFRMETYLNDGYRGEGGKGDVGRR